MYFKALASTQPDRFILTIQRSALLPTVRQTLAYALPGHPPGRIKRFKGGSNASIRSMAASIPEMSSSEIKQSLIPGSDAK